MPGMEHGSSWLSWLSGTALVVAATGYVTLVLVYRRGGWWPPRLTACWLAGLVAAAIALIGPLAEAAHHDFIAHMAGHLLLGMTASIRPRTGPGAVPGWPCSCSF